MFSSQRVSILLFYDQPRRIYTILKILTFKGPCIVIYSYNKTNEMH